jgi:O-antigen ligase
MNASIRQNVFLISGIHFPKNILFLFLVESILILSLLILGWKITFLFVFFFLVLLFCMINDLGYIYFLILISPVVNIFGIPYETIRFLKWVLISIIVFLVWQKVLLAKGRFLIPKTKLIKFMLLFLILAMVTTSFSLNFSKSILGLLRVSSFFALFLLVFSTLESEKDIRKLISTWIFVSVIISFYGIWQHFGGGITRIYSTFANPNNLGEFCFMTIPLIVSLGIYGNRRNVKIFYSLIFCILMLTLLLTGSRASWLGSLVAIIIVGILAKNKKLLFSIFAFLIIIFSALIISPAFRTIFEDVIRLSRGLTYRPLLWASCLNLIKDHLFLGTGLDALGEALPQYSVIKIPALQFQLSSFLKTGGVHNFYLRVVAEMGIFALLVFLYFLKVSFTEIKLSLEREKNRYFKALLTAGLALILATFVHAFFEMSNIIGAGSFSIYFWILLALIYSIDKIKRKSKLDE